MRHGVSLLVWGSIATLYRSQPPNLQLDGFTSRTHVCLAPWVTNKAVLPVPKSTEGRFVPISARGEQAQK